MFIVPITKMEPSLTLEELKKSEGSQLPSEGKEFGSFLKEAIREADQALQETSEMDRKLALGEIDDLHSAKKAVKGLIALHLSLHIILYTHLSPPQQVYTCIPII